jgi:UDP-N-acetylmuramoylalanine--D-glutamate ligase
MSNPGHQIGILGAGESGVGAALLALAKGYIPFVSDSGVIKPDHRSTLVANNISMEEGMHSEELLMNSKEIVKSPGIPDNAPIVLKLKAKNIPVISEIEFASRYTTARIIAVTGTNGKSTTTFLTYHLLKEAGLRVCMAGNVGNSFAREVINDDFDYYVLEISSFQLDGVFNFKADIAVLLNITPDHLDRYEHDMAKYTASKFRITRNQNAGDRFIYFMDDPVIRKNMSGSNIASYRLPVSLHDQPKPGAYVDKDSLVFEFNGSFIPGFTLPMADLPIQGAHNQVNIMSAVIAASCAGAQEKQIRYGLKNFINFPHRMEIVGTIDGITWVNDSKATNVDSVRYALDSYRSPVIWIAGGVDKGNNYDLIRHLVQSKVKAIVCLGKDNAKIFESFKNDVENIIDTDNLRTAVIRARELARPGDVVLLSPACASFDLFRNYIDRGDQFREAVKDLYGIKTM